MISEMADAIQKKREGYFKIHKIDCNTDDAEVLSHFVYCEKAELRSQLPALVLSHFIQVFSDPGLNH